MLGAEGHADCGGADQLAATLNIHGAIRPHPDVGRSNGRCSQHDHADDRLLTMPAREVGAGLAGAVGLPDQTPLIPTYCPHLDPIERLWGLMHKPITHNGCHETFNDFSNAILTFLREDVPRDWKFTAMRSPKTSASSCQGLSDSGVSGV